MTKNPLSALRTTSHEGGSKKYVILSMPSKQTCLQGFANEDIHKALAFFIKNAENGSFNALALSAE